MLPTVANTRTERTDVCISVSGRRVPRVLTDLDELLFVRGGWFALDGENQRVAGVRATGRSALALAGREARMRASLVGKELRLEERGTLLGGAERSTDVSLPVTALLSVRREAKYASLPLGIGSAALAGGLLVGGTFLFDGFRSGELMLASVGAALALGGIGLDLSAELWRRRKGAVSVLEFVLPRERAIRVRVESTEDADAFIQAIRSRLR